MRPPVCTEPVFAVTYEILKGDKPVSVSPAGYRLEVDEQYCLLVRPCSPSVTIQQVLIKDNDAIEVHDSSKSGANYERRFKVKDVGWTFLPFRFLRGLHTLRVEIITEGGSREILVPIIVVNFPGTLASGSSLLWPLAPWVAVVLPNMLGFFSISWLDFGGSQIRASIVAFVMLYSLALLSMLVTQHLRLRNRARTIRRGLKITLDQAEECE
jgi:hypothetical protein